MKLVKVTTNGCITIPAKLRKQYELTSGRKVKLKLEKDGLLLTPLATPEEIENNVGFLETKGRLLKALMEEK